MKAERLRQILGGPTPRSWLSLRLLTLFNVTWGFVGFDGTIPRSLSRIGSQTLVWLDWIRGVALLALALSGAFWRAYTALSGALWRSLVVSGGRAHTALFCGLWRSSVEHPPCFRARWSDREGFNLSESQQCF